MLKLTQSEAGLTLIEIMVSMVISSFVIAGVYGVYTIQQRSYKVQEQVAEMQQRLRSAMDFLARDIRMAGSNPDSESACGDKITTATATTMVFNTCSNIAGQNDYNITIQFDQSDPKNQTVDLIRDNLSTSGSPHPLAVAESVDGFEIQYFDNNGQPIPSPLTTQGDRDDIRAVKLSMLIRATYPDQKYTDTLQYTMGSGATVGPMNDNYHRRLLITTIKLRNML